MAEAEDRRALGERAEELLHDLAGELEVLRGRASAVAGEARRGRVATSDAIALEVDMQRLARTVSDLVSWTGARAVVSERVDPVQVIRAAVERHAASRVAVRLEVALPRDARIRGPQSFFERIAANLIRNATHYASATVRIRVTGMEQTGQAGAEIVVEDDGRGFVPGAGPEAGQEGGDARAEGVRFGLRSTAWLVAQLGGERVEVGGSDLGGAAFRVWLPLSQTVLTRAKTGESLSGLHVEVLDDDPDIVHALVRLLRRLGMHAEGGPPTPEAIRRLTSAALLPDVLLLDQRLGVFGVGEEVLETIRLARPELARRVVMMSGAPLPVGPGRPPTLAKPIDLERLRSAVESVAAREETRSQEG